MIKNLLNTITEHVARSVVKEDKKYESFINKMGTFGINGLEPTDLQDTQKELKRLQIKNKVNKQRKSRMLDLAYEKFDFNTVIS